MNCLKIDFRRENFREFAVTQCTTPTSAVSNCLKIDFRRENFREFVVTQCTTPTSAVSNCLKLIFAEKTFANRHRNAKFAKVFSRERNPLYGI